MSLFISPKIAITSSRRVSRLTNTFMKALSLVFNAPIIRRGTSNLDHIAYNVKIHGFKGFIVVYTRLGNPSVLNLYKLVNEHFEIIGRIFILGVHINRRYRGFFDSIKLINKGVEKGSYELFELFKHFFKGQEITGKNSKRFVKMIVNDLEVFRENQLKKLLNQENFKPSKLEFFDDKRGELILRIKVHHVWKSEQLLN